MGKKSVDWNFDTSSQIIRNVRDIWAHRTSCPIQNNEIEIFYFLIYFILLFPLPLIWFEYVAKLTLIAPSKVVYKSDLY